MLCIVTASMYFVRKDEFDPEVQGLAMLSLLKLRLFSLCRLYPAPKMIVMSHGTLFKQITVQTRPDVFLTVSNVLSK